MLLIVLQFVGAAAGIVVASSFLTKFADRIAAITGWGRVFVGGLLLAGATSLPELMVDLKAVSLGLPNLAVGDLLGSSLFNLLVLAILDFAFPSEFRHTAFSPKFLHHSLAAMLTIVLTAIVGVGIVSRFNLEFLGVSAFSWAIVLVYLYGLRLIFLEGRIKLGGDSEEKGSQETAGNVADEASFGRWEKFRSLFLASSGYFLSASAILMVAPYLVEAADELAKRTGLGQTFVGTTLVALATSLPELISTLTAFRIGTPDLALGNIFGSNAFNMILFVPLDFLHPEVLFSSVSTLHAVTALSVVVGTSVAVMGQLYRKKERSRFSEPSSETVVVVIVLFLFLLYHLKSL